jgi:hypothetical protein
MRRGNRLAMLALAIGATLALGAPAATATGQGSTVKVKTTLTISAYGYFGYVKAPNANCVSQRKVVLKQKGHGVLGRATSNDKGKWEVSPEGLHFKGSLPYKLYAEVKPTTQATAGPIYKCLAASSKTIEIAGG